MVSMNLNKVILNTKGSDDCCIINIVSKNEAINLMQNADLSQKAEPSKT